MRYTDAAGQTRTLTTYQRRLLLDVQLSAGKHKASPDPLASRLLEERGLVTRAEWHCPLDPVCVTGVTPLGRQLLGRVRG